MKIVFGIAIEIGIGRTRNKYDPDPERIEECCTAKI
jgi:hypothetical protein